MTILLIITPFNPSQTPNTIRWNAILEAFHSQGIKCVILTTKRKGLSKKSEDGVLTVYRAGYNTLYDKLKDYLPLDTRRSDPGHSKESGIANNRIIQKLVDKLWRDHYWPDGSCLFIKEALDQCNSIIKNENISHVISVGLPFSCHYIAKNIKQSHPDIYWHQDIQDPFSFSREFRVNNFKKYSKKNKVQEEEAFNLSDSISLTNENALARYKELFPDCAHKIKVIPPIYAADPLINKNDIEFSEQKFNFGFFGSFYEGVRSPESFYKFLSNLINKNHSVNNLQFHIFGPFPLFCQAIHHRFPELHPYINWYGYQKRADALSYMKKMDFLLNFGNTTDYHLPSKVVDYLYINRPVINFTSIENDSSHLFLKDKVELLSINLEAGSTSNSINKFEKFIQTTRTNFKNRPDLVKPYSAQKIAELYLNCLRN